MVAAPVTAAAAVIAVLEGNPGTILGILSIAVPAVVAAIATAIAINVFLIRRHRFRERAANRRISSTKRELQDEKQERSMLRELDNAIDHAETEPDAVEVIRQSFAKHLSMQPMELHLVHPVDPVLELALAAGDHQARPSTRVSPWDALAARSNSTIVYDTTDRLDVCPHVASRVDGPMSVIAAPVNAMGRLIGVLYGFGPNGQEPGSGDIRFLEDLARLIGARLAIIRASSGTRDITEAVDRLTGLPDRAAMQNRVLRLLNDRQPFTVAVADIDNFTSLNDSKGRDIGDRALQLFGRVARKAIRPSDIIGRIGGDEFLIVLPHTTPDDATRAFERLREELALAQAETSDPTLTLSIGVIGSASGGTIEEILHRAAGALDHAKKQGGNRVVVAHTVKESPPRA